MSQKASQNSVPVVLSTEQEALLTAAGGGLTNAQLRASPVPVSGPLTDAQLRATALPISAATLPLPTGAATQTTLAALLASIGAAGDAVGANTVIGQLKQIAQNTTPTI